MPNGSFFMTEVATSVAVPPPMPMMPCTRCCLTRSSTMAAAPAIWLLVARSRSLRYFSRTTSIARPPRRATSSVVMSPGKGGGSSMLKSSRMGSMPRLAIRSFTNRMSSPRVSRLQTMTMPFRLMRCRLPWDAPGSALGLLRLGPGQPVDHPGHRAGAGKAVLVPAVRHLLQHGAVHEDFVGLVLPLERRAGVQDDAADDVARLDRQARVQGRGAAAVDDLGRALGVEARGQRPPDAVPVVGLDVVVDDDDALDAVVAGGRSDHRGADVVGVAGVHLLDRHHHPEAARRFGREVHALDARHLHRLQVMP